MKIIGITGPTGSGKSLLTRILTKKLPAAAIDCDKFTHSVLSENKECINELSAEFGNGILNDNGSIDRKKLANITFSSHENTHKLNEITHKYIISDMNRAITDYENAGFKYLFIDGITLIESGFVNRCDKFIAVIADKSTRLQRILKRDAVTITPIAAKERISAQPEDEFYTKNADFVLTSDNEPDFIKQANELSERFK